MKKTIYMFLAAAGLAGLAGCQSESPFGGEQEGTGRVLTSGLGVELKGEQALTRAGAELPSVNDFTVEFVNSDGAVAQSYLYGQLPEIVTLKSGSYTVRAFHGTNPDAAFDVPYYLGTLDNLTVTTGNVTEVKDPVVCKLANVRVSITFDVSLATVMSADSRVTAHMGNSGKLTFTKSTTGSGYFAYVDNSNTLTAVFEGIVDGAPLVETRTFDDVKPGNHYKIVFKLQGAEAGDPGHVGTDPDEPFRIDADIEVNDLTGGGSGNNLNPDDPGLDPSERPNEDPEKPDDPVDPVDPAGPAPTITANNGIQLNTPVEITESMMDPDGCTLFIHSDAEGGIKVFKVIIDSTTLTEDVLGEFNIPTNLDMVNANDAWPGLESIGFPTNVGGMSDVEFKIGGFMTPLTALGSGTHKFILTVEDANGKTTATLDLYN